MTHFTRTLIAAAVGLVLLALPIVAGAKGTEGNRSASSEDDAAQTYVVADYGMVELTTIEEIANGQVLDMQTIRFLEDNIWELEDSAEFAGLDGLALGIDPVLGDELPKTYEPTGQVYDESVPWLGGTLTY